MGRDFNLTLKEKHIYKAIFEAVAPSTDNPDDDLYDKVIYYDGGTIEEFEPDEIVYYDGGGIEGYGN